MDRKQNQGEKMVERMNINNINENKYPVSQTFDPDSKIIMASTVIVAMASI